MLWVGSQLTIVEWLWSLKEGDQERKIEWNKRKSYKKYTKLTKVKKSLMRSNLRKTHDKKHSRPLPYEKTS